MIKYNWKRLRYRLLVWFFKDLILEELTDALHPDFGWVWQPPDGEGFKYVEQSFKQGYTQAQLDFYRDGIKGWTQSV